MADPDAAYIARWKPTAERLANVASLGMSVVEDRSHPVEGSPARRELITAGRDDWEPYIAEISSMAHLRLVVCEDYFLAAAQTIMTPKSMWPIFPLCRSAAEAAARVAWILDPNIPPHERYARHLADRVQSLDEAGQLGPEMKAQAKARRRTIVSRANGLGIHSQPVPGYVKLVGQIWGDPDLGELLYRLMSGSAHAQAYGLMRFVERQDHKPEWESAPGTGPSLVAISPQATAEALLSGFVVYAEAVERWSVWSGRTPTHWLEHNRRIVKSLRTIHAEHSPHAHR